MPKKKYLSNSEDIDAFAKSIGWFDSEPSEYTGKGNYRTRKAPSSSAKSHKCGTRRTGMDGKKWKVMCDKRGTKRWVRTK